MNWRQQDSERLTKREIFKESTKSECKYVRKELNKKQDADMHTEKDKHDGQTRWNDITESTNTNKIIVAINQLYSQDRKSGNPKKNDPLLSRFCSPTHQAALISSPCSTSLSSPHGSHSSYSSLVLMVLYVSTVPLVLCFSQSFPSSPPESYNPILSYPRFLSSSWLSKFSSS